MTIVIKDPEIEAMLLRMAEARGLTPEALVAELAKSGNEPKQRRVRDVASDVRKAHGLEALEGTKPLPKSFYDTLSDE